MRRYILFLVVFLVPTVAYCFDYGHVPFLAKVVIHKVQVLMAEKKYLEAAQVLKKFMEKGKNFKPGSSDPKGYRHFIVDFGLGNCYLMARDYEKAQLCYLRSVRKEPGFSREHNMAGKIEWKEALAQVYLACDKPEEALPLVEELSGATKRPKRRQWQEMRLHLYLSLDMSKKALQYVKQLIRGNPVEPKWWKGVAHLYLKENHYKPALAALIIKGFLEPFTEQEQKTVADLSLSVDIPAQAVRFYKKIAGNDLDPEMAYRIAQCYLRLNEPEEALKYAEEALLKGESDYRLLLLRGQLLYELERYQEAADTFEAAARGKLDAGRAWLMAGYAAWNAKDLDRAGRAFKQAARYPKHKHSALAALRQLANQTGLVMRHGW